MDASGWLEKEWNLIPPQNGDPEEMKRLLAERINALIRNDFQQLVQILYRADVPEQKLRTVLAANTEMDAGVLIAELLIKRQLEKAESRKKNTSKLPDDAEEKW